MRSRCLEMGVKARTLAMGIALAVVAAAPAALAQVIEVVELKDGSVYQGQLVEKVEGQRVVIQLATGDVKTFLWDDVARATPAPVTSAAPTLAPLPAPVAPPPPLPPPSANATDAIDSRHVITGWPDPHASSAAGSPSPPPPAGQQLDLGLVTSIPQFGSPRGIVGLMTEYRPLRWLGLEVSGAYDGPVEVAEGDLGWSLAETLHVGDGLGLGAGASQHFGALGSGVAYMGHAEGYWDLDLEGMVAWPMTVRMAFGAATMFNGGSHPGACGFFNLAGGSTDANGQPNDTTCAFVYFDVEVFFHMRLGGQGTP